MAYKSFHTIKKQKRSKKPLVLIAVIVILLGAGAAGYVWHRHNRSTAQSGSGVRPQNTVDYSPAKPSDNSASEQAKDNPSSTPTTLDNPKPTSPGTSTAPSPQFSVTVTGANPDNTNKVARVSTLVNGANNGTCVVTFSQKGQSNVTATNTVTLQNNSYVCPNFVIPYGQFPASGAWNVSVAVTSSGKTVTGQWQGGPVTIQK